MIKATFKRYILAAIISLILFSTTVFADVASVVTKPQADKAVEVLNITKRLRHFCAPCKNGVVWDEQITSVIAFKNGESTLWRVLVNGRTIDLAYVYFPLTDGRWRNLASWVGLIYDDVPEFLSGQASQTVTPTPVSPPPPSVNVAPLNMEPNSEGVRWSPVVEMNNQIFPSFFLATATQEIIESQVSGVIGDAQGKIGFHIINPNQNTKVKIGIEIDSILKYQEFEANLADKGRYYQIYPKIIWNWDTLKKYKKPSPANAVFTLSLNGRVVEKRNVVVRIRSINEAVYAYSYALDENRWANTSALFAAYVNEDHEWIDQILKESLQTKLVDSFIGYQGKPEDVINQIFAVWYVLQKRGFKYSSITNSSGSGTTNKVFSQYVRLFEESINASQANCVDGSVLIASILKKIGIRVGLVLVPGHCFLVFDVDGKGNWRGLETTMMGKVDFDNYPDPQARVKAAIQGFLDAITVGNRSLAESTQKIGEGHPQYKLIDIDRARKNGIFPIAW